LRLDREYEGSKSVGRPNSIPFHSTEWARGKKKCLPSRRFDAHHRQKIVRVFDSKYLNGLLSVALELTQLLFGKYCVSSHPSDEEHGTVLEHTTGWACYETDHKSQT
jgi:hypothetical protein